MLPFAPPGYKATVTSLIADRDIFHRELPSLYHTSESSTSIRRPQITPAESAGIGEGRGTGGLPGGDNTQPVLLRYN